IAHQRPQDPGHAALRIWRVRATLAEKSYGAGFVRGILRIGHGDENRAGSRAVRAVAASAFKTEGPWRVTVSNDGRRRCARSRRLRLLRGLAVARDRPRSIR